MPSLLTSSDSTQSQRAVRFAELLIRLATQARPTTPAGLPVCSVFSTQVGTRLPPAKPSSRRWCSMPPQLTSSDSTQSQRSSSQASPEDSSTAGVQQSTGPSG